MIFPKRFQRVEAALFPAVLWLLLSGWSLTVFRPWAIALDGTELARGLALAAGLGSLAVASRLKTLNFLTVHRAIPVAILGLAPVAAASSSKIPILGGTLFVPALVIFAGLIALALSQVMPDGLGRHPFMSLLGVATGLLVVDVGPGPWMSLTVMGTILGLALGALPQRPAAGDAPSPPALNLPLWFSAVGSGAGVWAIHRPWVSFLTPTRSAEAHDLAGAVVAAGLGIWLLRRLSIASQLCLAVAGAAGILWFTADLPLRLGLWGLMDQGSWLSLQLAQMALATGLHIPLIAPLAATAYTSSAPHPRDHARVVAGLMLGLIAAVMFQPTFGASTTLVAVALAAGGLGVYRALGAPGRWVNTAVALGGAAALLAGPGWNLKLMNGAVYPQLLRKEGVRRSLSDAHSRQPRFLKDDGHGAVAVFDAQPAPSLVIGGAPVGSATSQIEDERFAALLAATLRPSAKRACVLGPGTGASLAALRLAGVDTTAVGASQARLDALSYLGEINNDVLPDPAVTLRAEATRRHLQRNRGRYDLIITPPWPQWTAEGAFAWTAQRWSIIKGALTEGGLAVATIPLDSLAPEHLLAITAGFTEAFPHVTAWLPPSGSHDLVLIGQTQLSPFNYLDVMGAMSRPRVREALMGYGLTDPPAIFGRMLAGPQKITSLVEDTRATSDARPILDVALPGAAFEASTSHPLTIFAGADDDLMSLITGVEDGPTSDALAQSFKRSSEAQQTLLALLGSLGEGSYDQAVAAALEMGPRSDQEMQSLVAPYLERAKRDMALGLLDQANAQLGFATVLAPRQAEPWLLTARLRLRQEQRPQAEKAFRAALERNPESLEALLGLADLATEDGRHTEAIGHLERARAINPSRASVAHNLGELYRLIGPLAKAQAAFEEALLLDASLAQSHAGLADVLLRQGDLGRALSEAQTAVQLKEDPIHFEVLGQVLLELRDYNRARSSLVQCLLRDPDSVGCLGGLGIVYAEDSQYDKARETWQKILDLRPGHPAATENLRRLDELSAQRAGSGGVEILEMAVPAPASP